ncbi:MAG: hypothetical protein EOP56_05060 [Sphingobacteriales bacterium]|nr:MAG: hypothetical protein EOP56_05060 [Sphingobacteriales bacterium]
MVRIIYKGSDEALQQAVASVNALFLDTDFYNTISRHRDFDLADISPLNLSLLIRSTRMDMKIEFYYSLYPFSKALSFDDETNPQTIWLNKWNLNRTAGSLANTLMHQCIHAINNRHRQHYFGHGDNEVAGKENTAPYWIASLAQQQVDGESRACEVMYHDDTADLQVFANFVGAGMKTAVVRNYCLH